MRQIGEFEMSGLVPMTAALTAFVVAVVLGNPTITLLKRLKYGQTIREEGPQWHKAKQGTPTMGGILIAIGTAVGIAVAFSLSGLVGGNLKYEVSAEQSFVKIFAGIGLCFGMGLVGFADDYIKVVKKRNLGLTAMQKTVFQSVVVLGYLITLAMAGLSKTVIPFLGEVDITKGRGLVFWPIAFFFIYGFTNAVNLTDGIDGLASTVTFVVSVGFLVISTLLGFEGMSAFAAAVAGACLGFLVFNWHPAKMFMGDTGSMFLGGAVVAFAFGVDRPVYLMLAGIIYLIEAFSVILQVVYFKKTGKRLFKMSPIHHHFEKSGWSEVKIVFVFAAVTLVACSICVAGVAL